MEVLPETSAVVELLETGKTSAILGEVKAVVRMDTMSTRPVPVEHAQVRELLVTMIASQKSIRSELDLDAGAVATLLDGHVDNIKTGMYRRLKRIH